ncbi:MAG: leucine-rich repeat protein, partial [Lachnospiraceae bacterium]|nr:leucine-rich repeat protein [Lachnospiraceae bacterium]
MKRVFKRITAGLIGTIMIVTSIPFDVFASDELVISAQDVKVESEYEQETDILDIDTDGSYDEDVQDGETEPFIAPDNDQLVTDDAQEIPEDDTGATDIDNPVQPDDSAIIEESATGTAGDYEYTYWGSNAELTKYTGTDTEITIPDTVDGYTVTELGYHLFYGNENITKVVIPQTVTSIDSGVFYNCTSLTSINIPKSVTSVSSGNFNCIESASFDADATSIPNYCFYGAENLKDVTIPNSVTQIGNSAFYGCTSLIAIVLPKSLTQMGSSAFYNCSSLSSTTLPEGLTKIGGYAFYNCTSLAKITIPASVTEISSYAFNSVNEIVFDDEITKIPAYSLYGAEALTDVTIPEKVTEIGNYAFYNCRNLVKVKLPANLKILSDYAFCNCRSLDEVFVEDDKGKHIASIPDELTKLSRYAFENCEKLDNITIPAGCDVGYGAFYSCVGLKTLKISNDVKLDTNVFYGCNALTELSIGSNLTRNKESFGGVIINATGTPSWTADLDGGILEITGSGVATDFTENAPAPWSGISCLITTVHLDDAFTTIGDYFFCGLSNLTALEIPENVTSIGAFAFYKCSSLKYIEIPATVTEIKEQAFTGCSALKEMVFCGNAPKLGKDCLPKDHEYTVYYPEKGTGWTDKIKREYYMATFKTWDDTAPTKDVVLVLDRSGSMSGKMDTLKEASNTFVNEIGGRIHNTRIAVISYDDSAVTESDFTTNRTLLNERINKLFDRGGTEYLRALNAAETLLETSTADYRFMIMFSDGEPNDNKDNIYEKAAQMQDSYMMYSVGLGTSAAQRNVLINVAGDSSRYFEAKNIEALIQAFLNLAGELGRGETTTVSIKRNGSRRDLLDTTEYFCVGSDEEVTIYVVVGKDIPDVKKVVLYQAGKTFEGNSKREFTIQPGLSFVADEPIYVYIYRSKSKDTVKLPINLKMLENFTVKYYWHDGTQNTYKIETFKNGKDIEEPDEPKRDGYIFKGWYSTPDCSGYPFFGFLNIFARESIEDDISLYAKWKRGKGNFDIEEDAWGVSNSSEFFSGILTGQSSPKYKPIDKEISHGDYNKFNENLSDDQKTMISKKKSSPWGGSCFGMSSTAILLKTGDIHLEKFNARYSYPGEVKHLENDAGTLNYNIAGDLDVGQIESMMNFYYLKQYIGMFPTMRKSSDTVTRDKNQYNKTGYVSESDCIEDIIGKMQGTMYPVVLGIRLEDSVSKKSGGHAVIAYDLVANNDGTYSMTVYDCAKGNDEEYKLLIEKKNGEFEWSCDTSGGKGDWIQFWTNNGYDTILLKYALDINDLRDGSMLVAPSMVYNYALSLDPERSTYYSLYTSYPGFTVEKGEKKAVISAGMQQSGDLDIACYGNTADVGGEPVYEFRLPALSEGETYKITQVSGEEFYDTGIDYADENKGFYSSVRSDKAGTIIVYADGSIKTAYNSPAEQ